MAHSNLPDDFLYSLDNIAGSYHAEYIRMMRPVKHPSKFECHLSNQPSDGPFSYKVELVFKQFKDNSLLGTVLGNPIVIELTSKVDMETPSIKILMDIRDELEVRRMLGE
jgi:hypothetical protein